MVLMSRIAKQSLGKVAPSVPKSLPKLNKKIGTPKLAPLPKANMQVYKPSVM
jgi:hypothetical protein